MPNSRYVLENFGAAKCRQASVDELLRSISGFNRRMQEGLINIHQEAVDSSKIFRMAAEARGLCERLDELDAHRLRLRIQPFFMRDMLDHEKSEFSALVAE